MRTRKEVFLFVATPSLLGEARSEWKQDFICLDVCLFKGESSQVSTFPPRNLYKENGLASVCLSSGPGKELFAC